MRLPFAKVPFVLAGVTATAIALSSPALTGTSPKFFDDDPLWTEPNTQDASKVQPWTIDLVTDLAYNQFGRPGDPTPDVRAQNVNTIDEVPDGSWFTNRAGHVPLTAADVAKGPDTTTGPAPGTWTVTSAKSDGISPGFTIKDPKGQHWFLKFDPPGYRAMATGTEVAVTKLFWALGYHVPENHIASLRREQLAIGEGASFHPPGRPKREMRLSDIDRLLGEVQRDPDGSYRIVASKALEGTPLGGFRFYGTRPDDPNDIVPHEHRRELRGYGVFSAWFNHVDAKAINSMDTLVAQGDRKIVQHHLLDFGSTLGSGGVVPREGWEGYEYMVQPRDVGRQMLTFGLSTPAWRRVEVYENPAVGAMPKDNSAWQPDLWKPRVPNAAFLRAREDDTFWAAEKARAITDEMIQAAVRAGQFGSEEADAFLVRALRERRDAILRTYLVRVNPIVKPALAADGRLTFANAAVDAAVAKAPAEYRAAWATFDNATGETRSLGETSGTTTGLRAPAGLPSTSGAWVQVQIRARGGADASWERPVDAWFTRTAEGWRLVGFERVARDGGRDAQTAERAPALETARR